MPNQRLIDYINQNKSQYSIKQLKDALIQQGYGQAEVEEAVKITQSNPQNPPQLSQPGSSANFFEIDQQTKETMMASIIGLLIAEIIIFLGDFLFAGSAILSVIGTLIYAALGGAVAGFSLSKLYAPVMDFISQKVRFLMPFCNTFFKLLFLPVIIGSIIALFFSLLAGGLAIAIGAGLGGVGGSLIGGLIGGSLVLQTIAALVFVILGRFIYAKFMIFKVGKYYPDYRNK